MTAEPTPYDKVQDTEIEALKEITTTSYTPPDQAEYSYPVVGQPMNDEQWQYVTLALGDGVLDEGGQPYWLRVNGSAANTNSTNTMLLTVSTTTKNAQAILRGFYHRLVADKVITLDAVTVATTYFVVLRYDPLGHATPGGPITVEVVTSLDSTLGKHYVVLWEVDRAPNQLLTDATIRRVRPKITPMITVDTADHRPKADSVLWGTRCIVTDTMEEFRAGGATEDGPRSWFKLGEEPDIYRRGDASFVWPGIGARPGSTKIGTMVFVEGRVARGSGANFTAGESYTVMTLPSEHRPPSERRFLTKSDGTGGVLRSAIIVISSNGSVTAYPYQDCEWIGLDGCNFTQRT